jgi:hypothetical protein
MFMIADVGCDVATFMAETRMGGAVVVAASVLKQGVWPPPPSSAFQRPYPLCVVRMRDAMGLQEYLRRATATRDHLVVARTCAEGHKLVRQVGS